VYEPDPPVAVSVCEYDPPTTPAARELVVMVRDGALTAIVRFWEAVAPVRSLTCTVKLLVPEDDGTPEISPDGLRVRPEGREPDVTDHV
jgi:hypothetical protein